MTPRPCADELCAPRFDGDTQQIAQLDGESQTGGSLPTQPMVDHTGRAPQLTAQAPLGPTTLFQSAYDKNHAPNMLSAVNAVKNKQLFSDLAPRSVPIVSLAERVKLALDQRKISRRTASSMAGLGTGYLSMIINGHRTNITEKTAKAIAEVLHVRSTWLLTGDGPMTDDGELPETRENLPKIVGASAPIDEIDPDSDNIDPPESLPIYGNLPGWKEAEKQAKAAISLPSWVWARARKASGVTAPKLPVSQAFVLSVATNIYELTDPEEAMILTNKELQKQLEALRKRHANRK